MTALMALLYADQYEPAARHCDSLLVEAAHHSTATWRPILSSMRSEIHLRTGNLAAAVAVGRDAIGTLSTDGLGVAIGEPLATTVTAYTAMGRLDKAAALLRTPLPRTLFDTQFGMAFLHTKGIHKMALGHAETALKQFRECGEMASAWSVDLPSIMPWRTSAAQALLVLGDQATARELASNHATRAGAARPRLCPHPGQRAAQGTLGGAARATARPQLPRRATDPGPAAAARDPCRGPAEYPGADRDKILSDAEQRVATLAGQGHTNREISNRLFITVSTVKQHLTRIYRKLKVNSRGGAAPAGELRRQRRSPADP